MIELIKKITCKIHSKFSSFHDIFKLNYFMIKSYDSIILNLTNLVKSNKTFNEFISFR